jgi:DNA polymerase-3 subunit alpha
MAKQKERFLSGAIKNGHDKKKSEELFDLMAEFANYGFNKSHAAAYCVIAAQTAWLKNYYPVEFFAALLSTEMGDTDKVVKYIKLCRRRGIEIQPPHVSFSDYKFNVKGDVMYYSLGAIKGVGQAAVEAILEAREKLADKKFSTIQEIIQTVDLRRVNKKVVECLIKAGDLDAFGYHRAQMFQEYERILDAAEIQRRDKEVGQESLFAMMDEAEGNTGKHIELPAVEPWARMAQLCFEKEVLGFYLSDHPLSGYDVYARGYTDMNIQELKNVPHKKKVSIVGLVADKREVITKKGTRMAFLQVEDMTGAIEVVAFPDSFASSEALLKQELPLLITATVERDGDAHKLILERVQLLGPLLKNAGHVILRMNEELMPKLAKIQEKLKGFPGETRLSFEMSLPELEKRVVLDILEPKGVSLTHDFFESMQSEMESPERIEVRP